MRPHRRKWPSRVVSTLALVTACAGLAACSTAPTALPGAQPQAAPGQTGPAVRIGAGADRRGSWAAWLYPQAAGACLEILPMRADEGPDCVSGTEPFRGDLGVAAGTRDGVATAYGSVLDPAAVAAVFSTSAGTTRVDLVRPPGTLANGYGYFVTRFDPGVVLQSVTIVDAEGRSIDDYPLGRP